MGMATEDVMEGAPLHAKPGPVDLTVLVPVYNEAENLKPLLEKLTVDLKALGKSYEILIVDDGSGDDTVARLHELHRLIPVLAHWNGFRVGEMRTVHHPRLHGKTKFGAGRFLNGFLDLLAVMFLPRISRRPLHLFGRIGVFFTLVGAAITVGFSWRWVMGEGLRLRPALLFGAVLVILG